MMLSLDMLRRKLAHVYWLGGSPCAGKSSIAVWVVPSAAFQLEQYSKRDWVMDVLQQCSDKAAAFHHWMERDMRFAGYIQETAAERGLPVLVVDGFSSLAENIATVKSYLQILD